MKIANLKDYLADRPLDLKLFGQRCPVSPRLRVELLQELDRLQKKYGPQWVRNNSDRLLHEAKFMEDNLGKVRDLHGR